MKTPEIYTCTSCGYSSRFPLKAEEVAACHRMRLEWRMSLVRLAIIIVACIAVPILISARVACLQSR